MQKTSKKHEKMTEKTLLVVETIQEVASPRIYFLDPAIYAIYGQLAIQPGEVEMEKEVNPGFQDCILGG